MTGYSFTTPVWEGGQWVAPAVAGVTAAARIVKGPEDQAAREQGEVGGRVGALVPVLRCVARH